jgi:type IV pilus assembly protein PilB
MARIRLGDLMVRAGLIDEVQLESALSYQRQWGGRLGDALVSLGFIDEMNLWRGLSKQLGVPLMSLADAEIPPEVLGAIPVETAERLELLPVERHERVLTVATSEPNNIGALDEIAFRSGLNVRSVLAPAREIEWAIRVAYRGWRGPCPPPRTRRAIEQNPITDPPRATLLDQVASLSEPLGLAPPARTGAGVDAQLHKQVVDTLRAVVELCVTRGVFTRDELRLLVERNSAR